MTSVDEFEVMLLCAVVKDESLMKKTSGMVNDTFFSSASTSEVFNIVKEYYMQYNNLPAKEDLLYLYKKAKPSADPGSTEMFLNSIFSREVNIEFVANELNKYVRLREFEALLRSNYDRIKLGGDIDVSNMVSEMFRIQTQTIDHTHAYGVGIEETEFIMKESEKRRFVPTNIDYLNQLLGGGLYNGQLGLVLAPPNYGKTMALLNFAIYAYLKGNNVLFVTLEMPEFSIMRRVLFLMAGALKMTVDLESVRKVVDKVQKKFAILYRPVDSVTVDYLYSVYHQAMADGVKFDGVYIDYADLLRPGSKHKDRRFELSDIFRSLKAFAQILDVPVWSATQANRDSMGAKVVTVEHLSEDFSKAMISDVIVSLSEKMAPEVTSKLYLTKNREGQSNQHIDSYVNKNLWFDDDATPQNITTEGMTANLV